MKHNFSNALIEDWWRHNGLWDRQQASGILLEDFDGEHAIYLDATDRWWDSLTKEQKKAVYEDFFDEN